MTTSDWFQLGGGILEVVGLFTVAAGISDARARFTDRPSVLQRIQRFFIRIAAKLGLHKGKVIEISASGTAHSSGSMRLRIGYGFPGGLEERVTRLQEIAQQHEDALDDLRGDLDNERTERKQGDDETTAHVAAAEGRLEQRISEAAAGGLTLETWGVVFFVLGVILTTYGGITG